MPSSDDNVGPTLEGTAFDAPNPGRADAATLGSATEVAGPAAQSKVSDSVVPKASEREGFQVATLLGSGGMGKVYLAYEPALERQVALKELASHLAARDNREAFVREARTAARLHHPGIVPIHALTLGPDGCVAFTMQAIEGMNLRQWMDRPEHQLGHRKRTELGLEAMLKVCDALAYAHSRGVLHCDLKPENVMIGDYGSVYLMDWGLARPLAHRVPPETCGTPGYMSPEQARNEPLDVRSDVFGLGAILFELVTGVKPYGRGTADQYLARARAGHVDDIVLAARELGLSRRLRRIVSQAVSPSPGERYATVSALRDDLHAFLRAGFHLPSLTFDAGTLLIKEGESGDAAYLIVSGRCRVFRGAMGPTTSARILGPGEIFGELAVLLDSPRTASVEALDACTVLVIDRETLESAGAMEGWMAALMRALARRFRDLEERVDASSVPTSSSK